MQQRNMQSTLMCKQRRYEKMTYSFLIMDTRSSYSLPNLDISVTNILYQNATNKSDANIKIFQQNRNTSDRDFY